MNGNSLSVLFKKYSIPVILLVIDLALIILGVSNNQGSDWMMASSLLAISGVLSIIYVSGIIPGKISLFIGIPVALVAVYVLYQMGSEVVAEENKKIKKEEITNLMKQNL